jgi:hypothetical protein
MDQVNIFNPSQLQFVEICKTAIDQHYAGGKLPQIVSSLRARQKLLFHRKHIGGAAGAAGDRNHDFFNVAQSADAPFASNFKQANAPGDQFFIAFGVQILSAVGAAAGTDAEDTLDYGVPSDGEILNGLMNFDVNNIEVFKDLPVGSAVVNGETVPGYYRLPRPIVWEPDNSMDFELKLADAFPAATYRYLKVVLWGAELAK